jgi:hypothetical protein
MSVPQTKEERPASMLRAMFASVGSLFTGSRTKHAPEPATVTAAPAKPEASAPEAATEPEVTTEPEAAAEPVAEVVAEPEAEVVVVTAEAVVAEPEAVVTEPEIIAAEAEAEVIVVVAEPEAIVTEPEIIAAEAEAEVVVVVAEPEVVAAVAEAAAEPAAVAGATLPLANYDGSSVASLRARLRNLSLEQLTQLVEYEKGHVARADVIAMFERRIAKIQAEG